MICIATSGSTRWTCALLLIVLIATVEAFPSNARGERRRSTLQESQRKRNTNSLPDPTPSESQDGAVTSTSGDDYLPSATSHSNSTNTTNDQPLGCVSGGSWCNPTNSCIPSDKRCDGANDCPDGSDEQCQDLSCCPSSNFHFCQHNGSKICISVYWFCDGIVDCDSGEDENADVFLEMQTSCFDEQLFQQNLNSCK